MELREFLKWQNKMMGVEKIGKPIVIELPENIETERTDRYKAEGCDERSIDKP
jgi:hypothetical protein